MNRVRSIPESFDPGVVAAIEARLDSIEREHGAAVIWAVESGSRAWGFPSPDSDYDCRFFFVRPLADYLTVLPKRDVIELPIEGDLDINGWDIFKMAKLLLAGNATAVEWLTSPVVYRGDATFRAEWLAEAEALVDRNAVVRHYLHFGTQLFRRHFSDPSNVQLKKLFYVLRPAAALRWLRLHPERPVVPMHFPTLIAETDVPPATAAEISALLARKAESRELGTGAVPDAIAAFMAAEYALATDAVAAQERADEDASARIRRADKLLRRWLDRC